MFLDLEHSVGKIDSKQIVAKPNKPVKEECGIVGYPPDKIEYQWTNPKGDVIETTKDLNQKLEYGNYTCTASNQMITSAPLKYVLVVKEYTGEHNRLLCLSS